MVVVVVVVLVAVVGGGAVLVAFFVVFFVAVVTFVVVFFVVVAASGVFEVVRTRVVPPVAAVVHAGAAATTVGATVAAVAGRWTVVSASHVQHFSSSHRAYLGPSWWSPLFTKLPWLCFNSHLAVLLALLSVQKLQPVVVAHWRAHSCHVHDLPAVFRPLIATTCARVEPRVQPE